MSLPELIEIVPLRQAVHARITVPGSKSIPNRALILAALSQGEAPLKGALWSEDTQVMTECLAQLGFQVRVENDPEDACNRTIRVQGLGGRIPQAGDADKPLDLFVGNAGTAARFLAAGRVTFHGSSSKEVGSGTGSPGPVATISPLCTCWESSAVAGR